ncbi:MAG: pimeloyl-ACP methyl ester carboxylesterase [Arenicella sp.]|jgi:pimeloyl-ACP methyl ester carboxylesterase
MKDLILLHGALGTSSQFKELKSLLSDHFKVHMFDLEGHGKREGNRPFTMQRFAQNLKEYIIENDLEKPQIFGYSMGGFVSYYLAVEEGNLLGDIMSLGTKLKWDPLIAKLESGKLNPSKIEEKVPKFGQYLDSLHLNWKENMVKTATLMIRLGNGEALTFDDYSKIKNKCFIGLADGDEMVSCQETVDVDAALLHSHYYKLPNSRHPFPQLDKKQLSEYIVKFLA